MRVGLDGRLLLRPLRGMGLYVHRVLHEILHTDRSNDYLLFINTAFEHNSPASVYGPLLNELKQFRNLTIVDLHATNEFVWEQLRLPPIARRHRLDVFHFPANRASVRRVARKMMATVHDTIEASPDRLDAPPPTTNLRRRFYDWRSDTYVRQLYTRVFRKLDLVVTDSEHSRQDIERICGVSPDRLVVVPLAPKEIFRKLDVPKDRYLLMYGSEAPHKNCGRAIRAFASLPAVVKAKHPLLVVGEPLELVKLTSELGETNVHFEPPDFSDQLVRKFNQALGLVFVSLYEGFGIPPVEAMKCGTAVIASNTSCIPEVVGDAAILVDPYDEGQIRDAMQAVLTDSAVRSRLEANGLRQARKYSWKETAERHLALYQRLAAAG